MKSSNDNPRISIEPTLIRRLGTLFADWPQYLQCLPGEIFNPLGTSRSISSRLIHEDHRTVFGCFILYYFYSVCVISHLRERYSCTVCLSIFGSLAFFFCVELHFNCVGFKVRLIVGYMDGFNVYIYVYSVLCIYPYFLFYFSFLFSIRCYFITLLLDCF